MSEFFRPSVDSHYFSNTSSSQQESPVWTKDSIRKPEQGSDAFRLRYDHLAPAEAIRKDIESYLGEYRLQVQKYDFELGYSDDGSGMRLRSLDDGESMIAKANRATNYSVIHAPHKLERRLSEYKGIEEEESILQDAVDGDKYLYFSPPDPDKEDEEGKYGFAFVNQVVKNGQETRVQKTAIRLESQQMEQYRNIMSYITGQDSPFDKPEHFIANPVGLHSQLTEADLDTLLSQFFDFQINQENQQRFEMIMQIMGPQTTQFVEMIKLKYPLEDIQKTFYALENRALELNNHSLSSLIELLNNKKLLNIHSYSPQEEFLSFVDQYGYLPPVVGGSCGSTESESPNIFGFNSAFSSLGFETIITPSSPFGEEIHQGGGEEVCVTCPFCGNKEKNRHNGQKYICGSSKCKYNR